MNQGQQKKKGKSENPFSFKKFLSGSGGKGNERSSPLQQPPPVTRTNDVSAPNIHLTGDLPDFVQDHYSDNIGTSPKGLELPDFTLQGITDNGPDIGDSNFPSKDYSNIEISGNCHERQSFSDDAHSEFDENSDTEDNVPVQGGLINSLPDFLSDAAVSSSKNSDNVKSNISTVSRDSQQTDTPVRHHVELQRVNSYT